MGEGQFYRPGNLQEACELLAQHGDKARLLAGGTDLMVQLNRRLLALDALIYLGACGLDYIKEDGGDLVIGAGTTHAAIVRSELVQQRAPLLAEVISTIGSAAIQNQGTIGGNLGNASPAADSAAALLALGASLRLKSTGGERVVPVSEFIVGPGQTALQAGELIQEIIVPAQPAGLKWAFRKIGKRRADVCPTISMAVALEMDGGQCKAARIALGSAAPTPLLAEKAAALLVGKTLDAEVIGQAAQAVAGETSPIDDVRASAWYRRRASEALTRELVGTMVG
ncbi:MAG TPA: FAD binding domain-containing protein [Anaerolineae bacterium]|nr:FAD binding domain-containing protein [Anaerolineae bacterium]